MSNLELLANAIAKASEETQSDFLYITDKLIDLIIESFKNST